MSASRLIISLFLCFTVAQNAVAGELLFQNGKTDWKIYLGPQTNQTEIFAAEELRDALKKMSGADFEIVSAEKAPKTKAIIIGSFDNPEVKTQAGALNLTTGKFEEIAVYTLNGRLYLAGNQPRGALYAVYSFLQRELGVRWLWPGESGEFMPVKTNWELPELKFNHQPAIPYRGFHVTGRAGIFKQWMARNFINTHFRAAPPEEKKMGFYAVSCGGHAYPPQEKAPELFAQHPEYFAEIKGKRYQSNICLSNPEMEKIVADKMADYIRKQPWHDILNFGMIDNQDYCRCEVCAKKDVSTAWFEFYNRLTDTLKKEFPNLKFGTIAYQGYRPVPKCEIRNSEFIEYCSYSRCNIHSFGHPGCKLNEDTMAKMLAWKATGLPIGNYAYEYDIFRYNHRFLPFLSMIADAIKTGKQLGQVFIITEVGAPKPESKNSFHVQNRLSFYLYARLLWDPDQKMTDILRDWCQTVFGPAADPMDNYYLAMDRAWTTMPVHTTILGNALKVVPHFMTDTLRKEAAEAFAAADQAVLKITDQAARDRAVSAVELEKNLFKQWVDLYQARNNDIPALNLPRLSRAEDFVQSFCRVPEFSGAAPDGKTYATEAHLAWTTNALLVNWVCHDPQIRNVRTAAVSRDGKVIDDDSVELELADGVSGETWHFAVNAGGTLQDYRDSNVGVREDRWNPVWQAQARMGTNCWEAEMTIPFAALGQTPNPNESWQARFLRHSGGRRDFAPGVFPAKETALLLFSSAVRTDRAVLWWFGGVPDQRNTEMNAELNHQFAKAGWKFNLITTPEQLLALHDQHTVFWFRYPDGPNTPPADYWEKHFIPAISNGALAVLTLSIPLPLEKYFNDPSWKIKRTTTKGIPLAERRTKYIAPGDWSTKPNNLLRLLKSRITPSAGFVPDDAAAWTVMAAAPRDFNETFPYILARSYGKGMIFICSGAIAIPPADMLENFVAYHESQKSTPAACAVNRGTAETAVSKDGI